MSVTGTAMHTSHGVEPAQFEPGVAPADQARTHVLDLTMLDVNLEAGLAFTERLGVEIQVPLRRIGIAAAFEDAAGDDLAGFTSIHHRDETLVGLGDVAMVGRARVLVPDGHAWTLDLRAGLTAPTGNTEPDPFVRGAAGLAHQHMFFGTGTVDPILGVEAARGFDGFRLVGAASLRASLYENGHGYRGPGRWSTSVGAESGLGLTTWRFLVQPEIFVETPARWSGTGDRNSGRVNVIGTLGAFWMPEADWAAYFLVKAPRTLSSQGGQLDIPVLVSLGATYAFDL